MSFLNGDQMDDWEPEKAKMAIVFQNGNPIKKSTTLKIMKNMKYKDVYNQLKDYLQVDVGQKIRLFRQNGVEYQEEDLKYIIDGVTLYASKGEDFDANSSFGEYEITKTLGEGGFGKVLLGIHKQTKEKVAIKLIKAEVIGNAKQIDMIYTEAEVLKSLDHPNIIHIKQIYTLSNMELVFLMEYLEGGELLARLEEKGRFSEEEAKDYFRQLVGAMNYCHRKDMVHRDLKLENLLLLSHDSNIIRVCDFGIAGGSSNMKAEDIDAGSLCYMAPEVLLGQLEKLEPSIDIWAMGVILYCMLTGQLPFRGNTTQELVDQITNGKVEIPKDILKTLSPECIDVFYKVLVVDYKKRITTNDLMNHPWLKDSKYDIIDQRHNEEEEENKLHEIGQKGVPEIKINQLETNNNNNNKIKGKTPDLKKLPTSTLSRSSNMMSPTGNLKSKTSIMTPSSSNPNSKTQPKNSNMTELAQKYGPNQNKSMVYGSKK